jgi:hypothetical protein
VLYADTAGLVLMIVGLTISVLLLLRSVYAGTPPPPAEL